MKKRTIILLGLSITSIILLLIAACGDDRSVVDSVLNVGSGGGGGDGGGGEVPEYLAIVDVMVSDSATFAADFPDYTGLSWGTTTDPYIPDVTGTRVTADNVDLERQPTTVWVKYGYVPVTSDQPVLVDYKAFQWPGWSAQCPAGWQPANGISSGIGGALTPGGSACKNLGLCVQYMPMKQAGKFVTNVGLSYTGGSEAACAPVAEANLGYWPMQPDHTNINPVAQCVHSDGSYLYLCSGRGSAWPPMPATINAADQEKLALLTTYSPRVWIAAAESFWPSSVEWSFTHLNRVATCDPDCPLLCSPQAPGPCVNYWLHTKETLGIGYMLEYSHGCNGTSTSAPCTIGDSPVYAYWVQKQIQVGDKFVDVADLVYFLYYPHNRGKDVAGSVWGNHVGDWEHVTVRLMQAYDDQTGWTLKPVQIYLSAHDFGGIYAWDEIPVTGATHPVVYSAWGSHGVWLEAGAHTYGSALGEDLVDTCSEGTAWDTWNNVTAFDYNAKQGLGGSTWPNWMGTDFKDPGAGNPADPNSGPVYRWGNTESGCAFGYCQLENGPTGPVSKNVWGPGILK